MAWSEANPGRPSRGVLVSVFVFLVLISAAVTGFAVMRNVVRDNEGRLLRERAAEVSALLQTSIESSNSALGVLALLAPLPDQTGFELGANAIAPLGGGGVVALREGEGGLVVSAAAGAGLAPGQPVTGERAALAARALERSGPAVDLLRDGGRTTLVFAIAAPEPARAVVMLDAPLDPSRPVPRTPGSAFSKMRGAVYASPVADPARLVFTNEETLPLTGRVLEVPLAVAAEQWTLVVGSRSALVGSFPSLAPWLLLSAGVVAAVLTGAVVATLARRQEFANTMVDERTRDLDATRRFLERLLVSGPAVVVRSELSDSDRRISYVSPNVERVLGLKERDVMREGSLLPFFHPDDVPLAKLTSARLGESHADPEVPEFRVRHGDGSYRWVAALAVPEIAEDGSQSGMFFYLTDVSTRRAAEDGLRAAQHAAETANRSKSEFLSRMSHELRTPLNAVLGFSQLLKMQVLHDEQSDAVDQILSGGRHLLDLIDEVLDISRIEAGRLLLSPEAVLVSDLVRESIDLVRSAAEQRQITLVADDGGMSAYAFADRQRVKQVLLNLLSNAVKYNHVGGVVAVSCSELGPAKLRISVGDTGPGIRPEQMNRLFAPFDRLDAGQTDVEGTGIGLTLSRNLAEAMGGVLAVESTVGEGSTFSLDLPRVERPPERDDRAQPEPLAPLRSIQVTGADVRRHTVLYIEDNPSNLRLIERILARRDDVVVVSAMQGRPGIELAREHQPTIILLDLHLPDISGEEVLRCLRDDSLTASIPVVMVTADATAGRAQRLLSAGANAYLTKPLDVAKLLEVIDELLLVGPA